MSLPKPIRRKLDLKNGRVDLSHGAGGRAMGQLIEDVFHAAFDNDWLRAGNDQSAFDVAAGRMVMTTDAYVVSPIFFPGGDIGSLAVNGTINDIAMAGARPLYLSASFVIEEGFPFADLKRVAESMGEAARAAGTPIITGDTKVVERGKADKVFVSTAGVGVAPPGLNLSSDAARAGDIVIVSGTMGDHGVAVMSKRENLEFETEILSDTAALHGLVADMVKAAGPGLRVMRDPTRGGLAATLNELAHQSGVGFSVEEAAIPIRAEVAAACEFLGLDPLNVANEGKLVAIVAPEFAEALLAVMKAHLLGADFGDHRSGGRRSQPVRRDAHRLRRGTHRRLALRRAAPTDLLRRSERAGGTARVARRARRLARFCERQESSRCRTMGLGKPEPACEKGVRASATDQKRPVRASRPW